MNSGNLQRTLLREFKRSPAKTLVLIALLPLAGYFVGPLIWKSVSPKKSTVATASAVPAAAAVPVPVGSPTVTGTGSAATTVAWSDAAKWIEMDPRMRAASIAAARSPFVNVRDIKEDLEELAAKARAAQASIAPQDLRPEDAGLRLTATLVGSRLRLATINGKQYPENAMISVHAAKAGDPQATAVEEADAFVLKSVDRKFVILERNGKSYQLPLVR